MTKTPKAAGAKIVTALEEAFKSYVALEAGLPLVLALWTLATHAFDCFDAFPYLAITSPTKRCGKTRLAEIVGLLSQNGQRVVGATQASIFRMIRVEELEGGTVTLILDEAEVLGMRSERSETLREILNAGYRRGQTVPRCERKGEQGFEVVRFNVFCPKVLVLIGTLNDTLADRCIPILMRRHRSPENLKRFNFTLFCREANRLNRESRQWTKRKDIKTSVEKEHRRDLGFLVDREAELWSPLFSICAVAAPEKMEELRTVALTVSRAKQGSEPEDMGILLLTDLRAVFGQCQQDRLSTFDLLNCLTGIGESPWATWSHGSPLDARRLARLLRPFGISSRNLRFENLVQKGYERADFEEAWATYLPADTAATALQDP